MNDYNEVNKGIEIFKRNITEELVIDYKKIIVGLNLVESINEMLLIDKIDRSDYEIYKQLTNEYLNNNNYFIYDKNIMLGIKHALAIIHTIAINENKVLIKK